MTKTTTVRDGWSPFFYTPQRRRPSTWFTSSPSGDDASKRPKAWAQKRTPDVDVLPYIGYLKKYLWLPSLLVWILRYLHWFYLHIIRIEVVITGNITVWCSVQRTCLYCPTLLWVWLDLSPSTVSCNSWLTWLSLWLWLWVWLWLRLWLRLWVWLTSTTRIHHPILWLLWCWVYHCCWLLWLLCWLYWL